MTQREIEQKIYDKLDGMSAEDQADMAGWDVEFVVDELLKDEFLSAVDLETLHVCAFEWQTQYGLRNY